MSRSRMSLLWAAAIGSVSLVAPPTRAASVPLVNVPLVNSSFETPISSASFVVLPAGSTAIPGWTIAPASANVSPGGAVASIDLIRSLWPAAQGLQSIDLDGSAHGVVDNGDESAQVSQAVTLPTVPNLYDLRFAMSGNPSGPPTTKTLKVSVLGADAATASKVFTYDTAAMGNSLTDMKWVTENFLFHVTNPATQSHVTLVFDSLTPGIFGPTLDNVSLSTDPVAAPAPPALWAGAGMLGALGLAWTLKTRRVV